MTSTLDTLLTYVEAHVDRLLMLTQDLIRIPSENLSPKGSEHACQQYIANVLRMAGYEPELYAPDQIPSLADHPLTTPGRSYYDRPNLAVARIGEGQGRSLLLSGHIDTVPRGTLPWSCDAFTPYVQGTRLYGRGANDMKAGVALNLFLLEVLAKNDVRLRGDLLFESVVDEEFGGVNGTLAARLRGPKVDAAILTEPSSLRICAGQRGGRTCHLLFRAGGGVLGSAGGGVVDQLSHVLRNLPTFAERRRCNCKPHQLYAGSANPVPVTVTKIITGPWGTSEPITVPEECRVELFWQTMPGELQAEVDAEFFFWLDETIALGDALFERRPVVTFPIQWLPGSAIDPASSLCRELKTTAQALLMSEPAVVGIEGPCDLFVFHHFGIPAVLWGPAGGNTHGSDEYVEIPSLIAAARVLLAFLLAWCGTVDLTEPPDIS